MDLVWFLFAALSCGICLVLVLVNGYMTMRRNDLHAVQTTHQRPTSRFGGLAISITFVAGLFIEPTRENPQILENLACLFPIFLVGVLEDSGRRIAPRCRLLACVISSLIAIVVCGSEIDRLGFLRLDFLLEQQAVAIFLTVLVLTGVTQSFNLLDGLHGLCGFTAVIVALALAAISAQGAQTDMGQVMALLVAAIVGFLILNYPRGLLFLGDAGATCIGFILACTAIEMLHNQPELSPWALMLVFFWPIADTLLAINRRLMRHRAAMQPDRMHFHHVVMRAYEILVLGKKNRAVSNPAATAILLPMIAAPSLVGIFVWNRDDLALMATVVFAVLFLATYLAIVRRAQHRLGVVLGGGFRAPNTLNHRGGISE